MLQHCNNVPTLVEIQPKGMKTKNINNMKRIISILPFLTLGVTRDQLQAQSTVREKIDSTIIKSLNTKTSPVIIASETLP